LRREADRLDTNDGTEFSAVTEGKPQESNSDGGSRSNWRGRRTGRSEAASRWPKPQCTRLGRVRLRFAACL